MRKLISVGESGSKSFGLPSDFVTQTAAILARRGGGKTYTASVLAEGLLEQGAQVAVIDPLNAWWGLRSSSDGKKAGYSIVIFGGPRGDLPLDKGMARGIADLVAENPEFSCVLSLRHMRKGAQKQFVTDFADQLFHRKGDERLATALHLFIDEADEFCPQRVMANEARMVGAVEDLVRRGRQAGLGVTMVSQRSAAINKGILTQIEMLVVGQVTGPHDKKAVKAWIEDNADVAQQKKFISSLARLEVGQFWFWSPRWLKKLARVDVRKRTTFDSSATPKAGKKAARAPKKVGRVDLAAIRKSLEGAIKAAEDTDPKALCRKVAELERELRKKSSAAPAKLPRAVPASRITQVQTGFTQVEVEKYVANAVKKRDAMWSKRVLEIVRKFGKRLAEWWGAEQPNLAAQIAAFTKEAFVAPRFPARLLQSPQAHVSPSKPPRPDRLGRPSAGTSFDGETIPRCEKAILGVLVSRGRAVSTRLIALQSGYSIKSSGFKNALSSLRKIKGWIVGSGASIEATSEGIVAFEATGEEPQDLKPEDWLNKLPRCERAIFSILLTQSASPMRQEDIAEVTGYSPTSSGFKNALSKLRGLELIEGRGEIGLTSELFE